MCTVLSSWLPQDSKEQMSSLKKGRVSGLSFHEHIPKFLRQEVAEFNAQNAGNPLSVGSETFVSRRKAESTESRQILQDNPPGDDLEKPLIANLDDVDLGTLSAEQRKELGSLLRDKQRRDLSEKAALDSALEAQLDARTLLPEIDLDSASAEEIAEYLRLKYLREGRAKAQTIHFGNRRKRLLRETREDDDTASHAESVAKKRRIYQDMKKDKRVSAKSRQERSGAVLKRREKLKFKETGAENTKGKRLRRQENSALLSFDFSDED